MKTLLIIGHTFPEPTTTAAGTRMMQLISLFQEQKFSITFASTTLVSEKSVDLSKFNINVKSIRLNDSSFDKFIKEISPSIVMFDRFITEEQFGWRVAEQCPKALRILDTEDLHFLRKARQEAVKTQNNTNEVNLLTETAKREIASIYRCDLSLIISEVEMEILQDTFKVDSSILHYLPFLVEKKLEKTSFPKFEERNHFITIGNLLHKPNVDSVLFLKKEIWPEIRKLLPNAELHIYGAYAPQQISELHNKKQGFLIKGWTPSVSEVMRNARVCLAPLRFGAGLKGKFLEAFKNETPSVTTKIGAEGISGNLSFAGRIADNKEDIIKASLELYREKDKWLIAQKKASEILNRRFDRKLFSKKFENQVIFIQNNLVEHRNKNFIGQILQTQSLLSIKYMSMWIEEKNKHII